MNILQVTAGLTHSIGGPAEAVSGLALALQRAGHSVTLVIVGNLDSEYRESLMAGGVRVVQHQVLIGRRYGCSISAWATIKEHAQKSDLLLTHGYYLATTILACRAARRSRKRLYLQPHGSLETYDQHHGSFRKRTFNAIFRKYVRDSLTAVGVASEYEKNNLSLDFPNPTVVGLGVSIRGDIAFHHYNPKGPILFLARIAQVKRLEMLIHAFALLREELPWIELEICGAGSPRYVRNIKALVADLNLEEGVHFRGQVKGELKERYLQKASLLVLPSENENFSLAVAEAICTQLPVVISCSIGLAAIVRETGSGEVLENTTPETLRDAIRRVIDTPNRYRCNSSTAAQSLNWGAVVDRWEHLWSEEEQCSKPVSA